MIYLKPLFIYVILLVVFSSCEIFENEQEPVSPIPGKIVFSMSQSEEGSNQIYVMNPNGTGLKKLTNFGNDVAAQPSWSPDGTQIVFTTGFMGTTGGPAIFIMNADGSNQRPMKVFPEYPSLAYPGSNPKWSPDGTKIAYSQCLNCAGGGSNSEIFFYDFVTDTITRVTNNLWRDQFPTWSPDGTQLAFSSNKDYITAEQERFREDIYRIDMDGSNLVRLTETGNATRPNWHPLNDTIGYEWNINGNKTFLLDVQTEIIIDINIGLSFTEMPKWSEKGNNLLLYGREADDSKAEIRFFEIVKDVLQLSEIVDDNKRLEKIGVFDWFYDEEQEF